MFVLSLAEATNPDYGFTNNLDATETRAATTTPYSAEAESWYLRDGFQSVKIEYIDQELQTATKTVVYDDLSKLTVIDGYYLIRVVIAPAQIGDTIKATLYMTGEEDTEYTMSVKEYCEYLIANYNGNDTDAVKALAAATLEYGEAANEYFAYGASFAGTENAQNAINTVKTNVTPKLSVKANGKVTGVSFVALTKPEFRFYTTLTEEEAVELNGQINVMTGNAKAQFVRIDGTDTILLEVTEIKAENMGDEVKITIGDWTIKFCGNDFAWLLVQNTETAVLGAALYNYGLAANDCFAAKEG